MMLTYKEISMKQVNHTLQTNNTVLNSHLNEH